MENLTLKIEISYNEIRKMVARINGEVWDEKLLKSIFLNVKRSRFQSQRLTNSTKRLLSVSRLWRSRLCNLERNQKRKASSRNVSRLWNNNKLKKDSL